MFDLDVLTEHFVQLIRKSVCELPEDSRKALEDAQANEEIGSFAKAHLDTNLKNLALSTEHMIPICADTGFPVFFVRVGGVPVVDLGMLQSCAIEAIRICSKEGYIRPNAVDPLTRKNPGNNIGPGSPLFEWRVDPSIDYCELIYVPKGGGTEIFGPAFRTILPADGLQGVKKFVFDTLVVNGNRTGATCPPNIVGIGIGGTSEACMAMAKQAACLRKVGSRNPDPVLRDLEEELLRVVNSMGLGPLGMGGKTTIFDLHIEQSMTHLVGTPVAIAAQCPAARVGTLRLFVDGRIEPVGWPDWFAY